MDLSKRAVSALLILCSTMCHSGITHESTIEKLGLFDAEHTSVEGRQQSFYHSANANGYVAGLSYRFDDSGRNGKSAWLFNGKEITRLGLFDLLHTSDDGTQETFLRSLNNAGHVVGFSNQYQRNKANGQTAWIYDGRETYRIGLTGKNYTDQQGFSHSTVTKLNDEGTVVGYSKLLSGKQSFETDAWIFGNGVTQKIGLAKDPQQSGITISNKPVMLNSNGLVAGTSSIRTRGKAATRLTAVTAWIYDRNQTLQIGLTDPQHTKEDGLQISMIKALNERGDIAGSSKRYDARKDRGLSAWIYSEGKTKKVGLLGNQYTRSNGYQYNLIASLNEKGHLGGTSYMFDGDSVKGRTAWFYDGAYTAPVGLTDEQHIRLDGYRDSSALIINNTGVLVGESKRYAGDKEIGTSVWVYHKGAIQRIGIFDQIHTRKDGYQMSMIWKLNDANLILGSSEHYEGDAKKGETAWVYSVIDKKTYVLTPRTEHDVYLDTKGLFLNDDGVALGYFKSHDSESKSDRTSAFVFSIPDGFTALGVKPFHSGKEIFGSLKNAVYFSSLGNIVGNGITHEGNLAAFITRPVKQEMFNKKMLLLLIIMLVLTSIYLGFKKYGRIGIVESE